MNIGDHVRRNSDGVEGEVIALGFIDRTSLLVRWSDGSETCVASLDVTALPSQ